MAEMITHDIRSVAMQDMIDAGLNGFAVELLVESYASPKRVASLGELKPITIVWRGVEITLKVYEFPSREVPSDA